MSSSELIDAYDDEGAFIGSLPRHQVHREGYWHHAFHCLIVAMRNGVPTAILQRRSSTKSAFANRLDVSAAGHILSGESIADGVRELHEEMGIEPSFDELVELGSFRLVDTDPASEGNNRETIHAFLHFDDRPLSGYRPDPVELDGIAEMTLADYVALYEDPTTTAQVTERSLDGVETEKVIGYDEVCPDADNYMLSMLRAAVVAVEAR